MYRQQGVDINDKAFIEVIIRQMMRKIPRRDPGDTTLLSGTVVEIFEFEDANAAAGRIDAGETDLRLATDSLILMGITKASLAPGLWLSAASFQETTKGVLTDAAIKGKVDHLVA